MNNRIRRVNYPPGTILDSVQDRRIVSQHLDITTTVGSKIRIGSCTNILIVSEYPSPYLIIDRVFWWDSTDKNKCYPIYIRLIPRIHADDSAILVCKNGIDAILQFQETSEFSKSSFIREFMVDCVNEEFKILQPDLAVNSDELFISPLEYQLNNNTIDYLPNHQHLGYPWDVIYELSPELDIFTRNRLCQPSYYANAITETYLQAVPSKDGWKQKSMESVMRDFISPFYPSAYNNLAYDSFTKNMALTDSLSRGDIAKLSTGQGYPLDHPILTLQQPQIYEKVESFSSHILQFCNWVQKLPYTECIGKYILPSKCRGNIVSEMIFWQYANGPVINDLFHSGLKAELNNIVRYWNTDIQKIEFVMTRLHELYIKIHLKNEVKCYYIDLSIATLLTQTLIRVA